MRIRRRVLRRLSYSLAVATFLSQAALHTARSMSDSQYALEPARYDGAAGERRVDDSAGVVQRPGAPNQDTGYDAGTETLSIAAGPTAADGEFVQVWLSDAVIGLLDWLEPTIDRIVEPAAEAMLDRVAGRWNGESAGVSQSDVAILMSGGLSTGAALHGGPDPIAMPEGLVQEIQRIAGRVIVKMVDPESSGSVRWYALDGIRWELVGVSDFNPRELAAAGMKTASSEAAHRHPRRAAF